MSNQYGEYPYSQPSAPNPYEPNSPYGTAAPGGMSPYGQPYGALPEHPQGTLVLIMGILGIFTAICAPVAWVLGSKAKKEIERTGVHYANEQQLNIGRILGIVFSIIYAASILLSILAVVAFLVLAGSAASY